MTSSAAHRKTPGVFPAAPPHARGVCFLPAVCSNLLRQCLDDGMCQCLDARGRTGRCRGAMTMARVQLAQWSRKGSRRPPGSFDNQFNTHGPLHSRLGLYQWRPVHKSLLGKWQLRGHACAIVEILSHSLSDEIIWKLLFPSLEINYQGTWEPKRSRFFFMNTLW